MNQNLNPHSFQFLTKVNNWLSDTFSSTPQFIVSSSFSNLYPEVGLLLVIFGGFFFYLYKQDKTSAVLSFFKYLINSFILYSIVISVNFFVVKNSITCILLMEGTLLNHPSLIIGKLVLSLLGVLFLSAAYLDAAHNKFTAIELPFLLGIILWLFIFSLYCFNFIVLFLLMEAITLLVVVSNTLYFVFTGPKLIKPLIQFFILNLLMSTFYLLGVALLLYVVPDAGAYTLSYGNIWNAFQSLCQDTVLGVALEMSAFLMYFKLTISFMLITFVFKLTLAPFSIWVVSVYSNLPFLFLFLIMTIYKIVYALLFLRLFVNVLGYIDVLHVFWQNVIFLFVVPSMFVGCLAYRSQDLKTILAYTTISQMGYVVGGFMVANVDAIKFALIYLFVYSLQIIGIFIIFLVLQSKYNFTHLNQLFLVKKYNKLYYYILITIFFSLAGIPPLSGFFTKFFLFLHIYDSGFFVIAILGLISGFIMSLIYLQIVLQLIVIKPSHTEIMQFEHSKKVLTTGTSTMTYNRIVYSLHCFLVGLYIFNFSFIFILPKVEYISEVFVYGFIFFLITLVIGKWII